MFVKSTLLSVLLTVYSSHGYRYTKQFYNKCGRIVHVLATKQFDRDNQNSVVQIENQVNENVNSRLPTRVAREEKLLIETKIHSIEKESNMLGSEFIQTLVGCVIVSFLGSMLLTHNPILALLSSIIILIASLTSNHPISKRFQGFGDSFYYLLQEFYTLMISMVRNVLLLDQPPTTGSIHMDISIFKDEEDIIGVLKNQTLVLSVQQRMHRVKLLQDFVSEEEGVLSDQAKVKPQILPVHANGVSELTSMESDAIPEDSLSFHISQLEKHEQSMEVYNNSVSQQDRFADSSSTYRRRYNPLPYTPLSAAQEIIHNHEEVVMEKIHQLEPIEAHAIEQYNQRISNNLQTDTSNTPPNNLLGSPPQTNSTMLSSFSTTEVSNPVIVEGRKNIDWSAVHKSGSEIYQMMQQRKAGINSAPSKASPSSQSFSGKSKVNLKTKDRK